MSGPKDFAIIVGAMKSGTTSLFEILSQHPQIAPCREKEPFFFASEKKFVGGSEAYQGLWSWDPRQHRIALEASTDYAKRPLVSGVPERIATFDEFDFRFIYMMRNPFERIESHVLHSMGTKCEIGGVFERERDFSLEAGITEAHIAFSSYAYQMDAFAAKFGLDRLLPIVLEEFSENPDEILQHCCRFLGVDENYRFKGLSRRPGRGRSHLPPPTIWKWLRSIRPLRSIVRATIPVDIRQRLRARIAVDSGPRHSLTDSERRQVREKLRADYECLQETYGIDTKRYWGM